MTVYRITPKWVLAMLASFFAFTISLLVWLGCYAQPAKDDFISAVMFRNKSVFESLILQYKLHNGRLASALIMRFSPLQYHSFTGYKLWCVTFILAFACGLFLVVNKALKKHLHVADRLAIFLTIYLSLHIAFGNLAEFYYWLPAISCYGTAALSLFVLIGLLPKVLNRQVAAASFPRLFITALICFIMPLFSETGTIMALGGLIVFGYKYNQAKNLSGKQFLLLLLCTLSATIFAALSPGNAIRIAATPYERSITAITAGGIYALLESAFKAFYCLLPSALFCIILIKRNTNNAFVLNRKLLITLLGIICFLWLAIELFANYALGGVPPLRLQNSILLFAVFFIAVCVFLSIQQQTIVKQPQPLPFTATLLSVWICCATMMLGSPFRSAAQELIAGIPQQYDAEMKQVYRTATVHVNGPVCAVNTVHEIPSSLYISQPLVLKKDAQGWPYFNVQMAQYFGCHYLYADTLAIVPDPKEAFRRKLGGFRRKK